MANTNPNGANGTQSDPREQICWDFYVKSIQENRENAYKSAIDAGYAEDTARNITMNEWFKERLRKLKRKEMFSKAERNLDYVLDMVAKTLGKEEGYSERTELTGKDGKDLIVNVVKYDNDTASV